MAGSAARSEGGDVVFARWGFGWRNDRVEHDHDTKVELERDEVQAGTHRSELTTAAELRRRVGRPRGRRRRAGDWDGEKGCGRALEVSKKVAELVAKWDGERGSDDGESRRRAEAVPAAAMGKERRKTAVSST
jgi:hypothetical protein